MIDDTPMISRSTTLPMLASITLTGFAMALVIVWQATAIPVVAFVLVPSLAVLVTLILAVRSGSGETGPFVSPSRRRTLAVGLASVALVATVATAGDWNRAESETPSAELTSAESASGNGPVDQVASRNGESGFR